MTCRLANVLHQRCGVKKGDRVIIYMPTCPMAVAAMLACARIGAVHWYEGEVATYIAQFAHFEHIFTVTTR